MKKIFGAAVLAGAMAIPMATTTSAQPPVVGAGNLVNVQVGTIEILNGLEVRNVLNDLTVSVGVAAQIAANVCGVSVGVIARDVARGGSYACETAEQFAEITQ